MPLYQWVLQNIAKQTAQFMSMMASMTTPDIMTVLSLEHDVALACDSSWWFNAPKPLVAVTDAASIWWRRRESVYEYFRPPIFSAIECFLILYKCPTVSSPAKKLSVYFSHIHTYIAELWNFVTKYKNTFWRLSTPEINKYRSGFCRHVGDFYSFII